MSKDKEIEKLKKLKSKTQETLKNITERLRRAEEKQAIEFARKLAKIGIHDEASFEQYIQKIKDQVLEEILEIDKSTESKNHS